MRILTLDNKAFEMNEIPDEVEDLRFGILDNSDPKDPDFFFIPLIFLESFSSPAIVLELNGKEVMMPIDWHIAVGDSEAGNDLEVLPLTSINDRGFEVFLFNPLTSYKYDFGTLQVKNFYNDVKWYFPKMKNGQLLSVPLSEGHNPQCAYFVKDISRQMELIDYGKLI
mgnify:CR=1 FL=1